MHRLPLLFLTASLIGLTGAAPTTQPLPRVAPVAPADAPKTFRALDGFHMDLIAAEPLVTDPVAMAYDEDGRAYVLEMNDYPYTDKAHHQAFKENTTDKPIGRVRLLEDTDGDGVFDKSYVFAEGFSWPTGIACYKGGVFVLATPDLWYLKSTKGDHKADVRRKVFTGFRKYNIQAVANNLTWALDGKIYGAGGSNGGTITCPDHPEPKPVPLPRNDFRFDPVTERFEAIAGGARFGNTFDDWGHRFVCNIRNPAQHIVIDDPHYLARNPYFAVPSVVHDVAQSGDAIPVYRTSPMELWRDIRGRRWSTDGTVMPRSELVAGGVVTSSSGVTIYRGSAYPEAFRGMWFLGEPANNLVLRQAMTPDGVTFTSHRVDQNVDFVTSTDIWCRPVNFVNAPDGTLDVLDMYREVIEHPWSIPDDIRDRLDLESGRDKGRIYRLTPPSFQRPPAPHLSNASTQQLVELLGNGSSWWRETAQRLLLERQDKAAIELLRTVLRDAKQPLARLHAMWTLEGLGVIEETDVRRGMADESAGVRENAIRVAELHLHDHPRLIEAVLKLTADDDPRVRFQAALTAGDSSDPRVTAALAALLRRDAGDAWLVTAALSSAADRSGALIADLLPDAGFTASADGLEVLRKLALVVGGRNEPAELARTLTAMSDPAIAKPVAMSVLGGVGEGLRRHHRTLRQATADPAATAAVDRLLAEAYQLAADDARPVAQRVAAIQLLGLDDFAHSQRTLQALLAPRQPEAIQRAAVAALAASTDPHVGPILLAEWRGYTPPVRDEVLRAVFAYKNRLPALLDALQLRKVSVRELPTSRRNALLRHADAAIRTRAAKLIAAEPDPSAARKEAVDRYLAAVPPLKGDPAAGHKLYQSICIACHRLGAEGYDVGPNLGTVRQWSVEQLIVNILDPNREVAPSFVEYSIEMNDGEQLSGVIADESPSGLTLKWANGGQRTVVRRDVKKISSSRLSPMPEGLESGISPQQMADLAAFLRGAP